MELRNYQKKAFDFIVENIIENDYIVLAAAPNAGKTFTTAKIIRHLLEEKKINNVVVLAHYTSNIRTQFYKAFKNEFKDSDFKLALVDPTKKNKDGIFKNTKDAYNAGYQIIICLPANIRPSKKDYENISIDMVVVDEAHQGYLTNSGKTLDKIEFIGAKKHLLLSGTPSVFIKENNVLTSEHKEKKYLIYSIPMLEIREYMANLKILVCESGYEIKDSDYNQNMEIENSVANAKMTDRDKTETSVDNFMRCLKEKYIVKSTHNIEIKEKYKNIANNSLKNISNITSKAVDLLYDKERKNIKCLIFCKNEIQAKIVFNYLEKEGSKVLLSTNKEDYDSENIEKFKKEDFQFLVLINRARLGFDLHNLNVVVDMSGTRNINMIYQMFARVCRRTENNNFTSDKDKYLDEEKLFVKISPYKETESTEMHVNAALCLTSKRYLELFDGTNFLNLKIPRRITAPQSPEPKEDNTGVDKKPKLSGPKEIQILGGSGLPVLELLDRILSDGPDNDELIKSYSFIKIKNLYTALKDNTPDNKTYIYCENYLEIIDWCQKRSINIDTYQNFIKNNDIYSFCYNQGWMYDICMEKKYKKAHLFSNISDKVIDAIVNDFGVISRSELASIDSSTVGRLKELKCIEVYDQKIKELSNG